MARKKKRGPGKPARRATRLSLELAIPRLEMARGHDGLLRGEPEPVLLLGVFYTDGESLRPLGRTHVRFSPRGVYPLVVAPDAAGTIAAPVIPSAPPHERERLVVLAIAVEEDGGEDVARLYAALENGGTFAAWARDEVEPLPRPLSDAFAEPVTRVYLLEDGRDLRAGCTSDELIGAAVVTFPVARGRQEFRVPFASERNDWLAVLTASL